jgi:hypothetical protein
MATHIIPILGANTVPDTSGDVYLEPYDVKASNDVWDLLVFIFNDTATRIGLRGMFRVPENYVGTAAIIVEWTSTATSGDVEWDFDYRAVGGNDTESMDQAGTQESVNSNDTAPGAANRRLSFSLSLTSANLAAGDLVEFELFRDGTDGGDTMAAAAILFGAYFSYADA